MTEKAEGAPVLKPRSLPYVYLYFTKSPAMFTSLFRHLWIENYNTYDVIDGWWTDAGTFESIFRANEYTRDYNIGGEWEKIAVTQE